MRSDGPANSKKPPFVGLCDRQSLVAVSNSRARRFFRAVWLCGLVVFSPRQFIARDSKEAGIRGDSSEIEKHTAFVIQRAFWISLLLVIAAALIGGAVGSLFNLATGCATASAIRWLQVAGAGILLWGTLFFRGWEIATWSGDTPSERVNQWLYRGLHCIGTATIVLSLTWRQCL